MNLSVTKWGARLAVLLMVAGTITGCGDNDKDKPGGGAGRTNKSMAITPPKAFNEPPGADPSVSAEMGGNGFEKIAADSGWNAGNLPAEDFKYIADTSAVKGGQITIAIDEYPATFRAYGKDENTAETRAIYNMVYEGLLTTNPLNLDFLPSLASHWKVAPDGQTYYFRINPDSRFSDGHRVTSEDVIATYNLGMDAGILSPSTNAFFADFEKPVAISPYIVSVKSKQKNWKNLLYFGGTPILPAHVIGKITGKDYLDKFQYEMPPGTGPYMVQSADIKKGTSVAVTRRTDWWAKDIPQNRGQYNFDKVVMTVVRDERLQLERFKKGETDIYLVKRAQFWVEEFNFDEVKRGLIIKQKIYNNGPTGFAGIAFNTKRAPFNDIKVRQAIGMLFNRKQIIEKVMFNQYDLVNSLYPGSEYENPNNPKQEYNPTRAAELLAEAGYTSRNAEGILVKNGQPFVVDMLIYKDQERFLTPVQQDLKNAGIQVNLRTMDQTTWFTMLKEQNYQMALMGWGGLIYPNPKTSFKSDLADHTPSNNITAFKDARVDQIVEAEQTEFDPAKRRAMLRELDSIFTASYNYAYSWYAPYQRVIYWNKFGMPEYVLGRLGDWRDLLALWWIDPAKEEQLMKARRDRSITLDHPKSEENRYWQEWNKTRAAQQPATTGTSDSAAKPTIK
jgi:microcin C transport system substrate-binding protein